MRQPHELLREASALLHDTSRLCRRELRLADPCTGAAVPHLLRCAELAAQVELLATATTELVEAAAVVAAAAEFGPLAGEPQAGS